MSSSTARSVVIGSVAAAGTFATIAEIRKSGELPPPRAAVGAFAAGVGLTALAGPAPRLAAALAAIVLVSTLLARGPAAITLPRK